MDKKPNLVDRIRGMFGSKKRLSDLSMDEVNHEKVRLEQEERKLLKEVKELEEEKRRLFTEGTKNSSVREQTAIARRIRDVDRSAAGIDRMLQANSKQLRIINGLIELKRRERTMTESGIGAILKKIDMNELLTFVDQASVNGEFQMDKFDDMIRTLEQADSIAPAYAEDDEVMSIVQQMQAARESADNPESLEQHFADMNQELTARQQDTEADEG